jgi:hypothetical protein
VDRAPNVLAHEREAPNLRRPAPRADDLQHRLFEFEECLTHTAAGFADALAREADFLMRRDRRFQ